MVGSDDLDAEERTFMPGDPFPPYPSFLSERLAWAMVQKAARENRKVTYADLTRATDVSKAAVSFWKLDKNGIKGETARKAAQFLDVSPVWLETGYGTAEGDYPNALNKVSDQPTPIQTSLVKIVESLITDGKLSDAQCLDLIAYIRDALLKNPE
jgi:transcriptional regulator with XRE-family HTH domain